MKNRIVILFSIVLKTITGDTVKTISNYIFTVFYSIIILIIFEVLYNIVIIIK